MQKVHKAVTVLTILMCILVETLIQGLKRLEYRGYDSAGLACDNDDKATITIKRPGKVANLEVRANRI